MSGEKSTISPLSPGHIRLIHLLAAQAVEDWLAQQANPISEPTDASRNLRPLQQRQATRIIDR